MMPRLPVQKRQYTADDRIPSTRKPAGLLRWQRFHVTANALDEESLRHLGEED
jgi:hypothetical protein